MSLEHAAIRILSLPPTTEDNLERVVLMEAETVLPLDRDELALSQHVLGMTEQSRLEVLLAAARQSAVQETLRRVNCAPWISATATVSSIALLNALQQLRGSGREAVCAVLRVEEGGSELVVLDRMRPLIAQTIPIGCGGASSQAEQPAVAVGAGATPRGGDGGLPPALSVPWTEGLAQQVRYVLQALSYERALSIERLYLCGAGAASADVDWQLSERLDLPVTRIEPEAGGDDAAARYAVAYGAAVQAAGAAVVEFNLTPARVTVAREVEQRRQVRVSWFALSGSLVIALALVFGAMVYNTQQALWLAQAKLQEMPPAVRRAALPPAEIQSTLKALDESQQSRVSAARLLTVLGQRLPAGAWLAELSYSSETGCVIRGYSLDPAGAQQAQFALLRERLFDEVTLDYRTEDRLENRTVWGFQLTCKLAPRMRDRRGGRAR